MPDNTVFLFDVDNTLLDNDAAPDVTVERIADVLDLER